MMISFDAFHGVIAAVTDSEAYGEITRPGQSSGSTRAECCTCAEPW